MFKIASPPGTIAPRDLLAVLPGQRSRYVQQFQDQREWV